MDSLLKLSEDRDVDAAFVRHVIRHDLCHVSPVCSPVLHSRSSPRLKSFRSDIAEIKQRFGQVKAADFRLSLQIERQQQQQQQQRSASEHRHRGSSASEGVCGGGSGGKIACFCASSRTVESGGYGSSATCLCAIGGGGGGGVAGTCDKENDGLGRHGRGIQPYQPPGIQKLLRSPLMSPGMRGTHRGSVPLSSSAARRSTGAEQGLLRDSSECNAAHYHHEHHHQQQQHQQLQQEQRLRHQQSPVGSAPDGLNEHSTCSLSSSTSKNSPASLGFAAVWTRQPGAGSSFSAPSSPALHPATAAVVVAPPPPHSTVLLSTTSSFPPTAYVTAELSLQQQVPSHTYIEITLGKQRQHGAFWQKQQQQQQLQQQQQQHVPWQPRQAEFTGATAWQRSGVDVLGLCSRRGQQITTELLPKYRLQSCAESDADAGVCEFPSSLCTPSGQAEAEAEAAAAAAAAAVAAAAAPAAEVAAASAAPEVAGSGVVGEVDIGGERLSQNLLLLGDASLHLSFCSPESPAPPAPPLNRRDRQGSEGTRQDGRAAEVDGQADGSGLPWVLRGVGRDAAGQSVDGFNTPPSPSCCSHSSSAASPVPLSFPPSPCITGQPGCPSPAAAAAAAAAVGSTMATAETSRIRRLVGVCTLPYHSPLQVPLAGVGSGFVPGSGSVCGSGSGSGSVLPSREEREWLNFGDSPAISPLLGPSSSGLLPPSAVPPSMSLHS